MRLLLLLAGLLPLTAWASDGDGYVRIPPGDFTSTLAYEDARGPVRIAPFGIMRHPVTNAEFLAFVNTHPAWRRDRAGPPGGAAGHARQLVRRCRLLRGTARAVAAVARMGIRRGCRHGASRRPRRFCLARPHPRVVCAAIVERTAGGGRGGAQCLWRAGPARRRLGMDRRLFGASRVRRQPRP